MANEEHLAILRQGVDAWNAWRKEHFDVQSDFNDADLFGADLFGADLSIANLSGANLSRANLAGANLREANLCEANLCNAELSGADLCDAELSGADLSGATLEATSFNNIDLSQVKGLDTVKHEGPSSIGIDTIYQSRGKIPEVFLRRCGVPDSFIDQIPSLIRILAPIQFYSCFISHSNKDHDFAQRLYERMQSHHLRVWIANEDLKGGHKIDDQIDQAIRVFDKLILVLSEQSIRSKWVLKEIRKTRKAELDNNRRKFFPIRLVDMDALDDWECLDPATGQDLAQEVREYFIPDFTHWKDHDAFEREFTKLLAALKAVDEPPAPRVETRPQNPQAVRAIKKQRLELLEEKQATYGTSTPPEVTMEINSLRREIAELGG